LINITEYRINSTWPFCVLFCNFDLTLYYFEQRAFDNISEDGGETKLDVNDPTLVMSMKDGEMVLTLTLSLGGVWKPEFVFTLLPVGLEKVDVLEAKLRDAQDEIELLRAQVEAAKQIFFFSATPTASCTPGQHVVWSTPTELGTTHFAQSEDKKQVRILVAGVYQVNVRLGATNTTNGAQLGLQKNGADYANCSHSDTNGHYASFQISELMRLAVGDTLQVRWAGSGASFTAAGYTRFSIQYLGF